jgi:ABC-2 type transport system ATP-binding protein
MLVYDFLNYAGRVRNMSTHELNKRIQELVTQCGLRQIMHKPIGELSKGLKQRVGLAHALLHDPEILILDEPTSGLDPNQILEIRSLIKDLGHNKTIILSTHILSEAEATCDRMVIIHQGRIAADGSPDTLKQGAAGGEVKLTLAGAGLEQAASLLSQIPGVQKVYPASEPKQDSLELTMATDPQADPRADIYRAVKTTDWDILEFTGQSRSLETIFKELTQEQ